MPNPGSPSRKALRVALLYALAAALWIAVSDPLAGRLADLPRLFTSISLFKGMVFVGITAGLLFALLRRDYAALQQTSRAAQQKEQLLQETLDALPVGVWLLDGQGRITYGNPEGTRIWGGARYLTIDDFAAFKGWWAASGEPIQPREWGAARAILQGERALNEEIEIEGFDGMRRIILHSAVPQLDDKGDITGAIVVNQEITELKQTQTSLLATEEILSKLLDNAPAPIHVTSAEGRIKLVNKAWCELFGVEPQQVVGLALEEFCPPEVAARYLENNGEVLATQATLTLEEPLDLADGRRYFQSIKFPVLDVSEGRMATAGISIDVTERKRMEEQLKADQEKLVGLASELTLAEERERRRIAAGLHDEIAQPLALARIRLGQLGAEETVEGCRRMGGEVRKLIEETIRKIRTFIFELSPPILYELGLEAALRTLAERIASQHDLAVDFADDGRAKPLAEGLQVLLFQAVRELLVNILKHAGASRAKVAIGREGDTVRVVIEDNGTGMRPESGDKFGFGLFSIRERLRHFGGTIEFVSTPGRGTRVTLSVPAGTRPEEAPPS